MAVAGVGIFSAGFYCITSLLLRRWLGQTASFSESVPLPPVTFFRPVKKGEPGLERNLEVFLSALEPEDRVIFAATSGEEFHLCETLATAHPRIDAVCLRVQEGIHRNPKVNKLAQMEIFALHEHWIVLDSDTLADRNFLRAFRREWQSKGSDAISAPYAFHCPHGLFSRLDALGTAIGLWPGVALLRATGQMDFLTGACMGVKAQVLRNLGGWKILGKSLAEDNELGRRIRNAAGRVDVASAVLPLQSPSLTGKDWLLHQHRAYVTFRLCNPAGSLGIPLTHGVGLSFFFALLNPFSISRWLLHFVLLLLRWKSAMSLPGSPGRIRDLWIVSVSEPFFWLLSRLPLPVRWGGKWMKPEKLGS